MRPSPAIASAQFLPRIAPAFKPSPFTFARRRWSPDSPDRRECQSRIAAILKVAAPPDERVSAPKNEDEVPGLIFDCAMNLLLMDSDEEVDDEVRVLLSTPTYVWFSDSFPLLCRMTESSQTLPSGR